MRAHRMFMALLLVLLAGRALAQQQLLDSLEGRSFAEKPTKLALVVWAQNYKNLAVVENAENDGNRIGTELSKLGFQLLRTVPDASSRTDIMDKVKEIRAHIDASAGPVMVVFYFAGHGFQVEGDNYLAPTSVSNASTDELMEGSVRVEDITTRLTPGRRAGTLLMMLDACRTVRFADGEPKDFPLREDLGPGFQQGNAIPSALISTSAAPDHAARSRSRIDKNNSPYTLAVASLLGKEKSLDDLLKESKFLVEMETEVQSPSWTPVNWSSTFFFTPSLSAEKADEQAWDKVTRDVDNIRSCAFAYLLTHPTGKFATRAEYLFASANSNPAICQINEAK